MTQDILGYLFIVWAFIGVSTFVAKNMKKLKSKDINTTIVMCSQVTNFWSKIVIATVLLCTS